VDDAGSIRYLVDPGIGGREPVGADGRRVDKLDSPKAQIMALVVDGILTQKLPWGLILIGAALTVALELMGLSSLPIAVGVYLPISTSATMFAGGVLRWLVDRRSAAGSEAGAPAGAHGDSGPGVLFSSGLIAGGAIMGVVLAALGVQGWTRAFDVGGALGHWAESPVVAMTAFVVALAVPVYLVGRRRE
jgi:uncharacterized oligopeptide transporter (OPT) family protein